jgi:hypothetical protein
MGMIRKLLTSLTILALVGFVAASAFAAKLDELNEPKDYSNDFEMLAGARQTPIITEDFEGSFPPAGWTVTDDAPGANTTAWSDLAGCGEAGNFTNGSGDCACVSTDIAGIGVNVDTQLITSSYSFAGYSDLVLAFTANYQSFQATERFDVDYSIDGGTNWNNILTWAEDHGTFRGTPGVDVALDMSGADGQGNVKVRFYHYDPATNDWDWYAQVDDVVIEGDTGGGGTVPTTTGIGIALMVLVLLGSSAYFLRRRATN